MAICGIKLFYALRKCKNDDYWCQRLQELVHLIMPNYANVTQWILPEIVSEDVKKSKFGLEMRGHCPL